MIQKLLLLALAGGVGTLGRYALAGAVQRLTGVGFPWGTAAVNAIGCFLFGLVWAVAAERLAKSSQARTIVLVGFMGAFTTFSTFISETGRLAADGQYFMAAGNMLLQNAVGIVLLFAGLAAGRCV